MKDYFNDVTRFDHLFTFAVPYIWKTIFALVFWFVGSMLVRWVQRIVVRSLEKRKVDPTLVNYADHSLHWFLKAVLVIGIFGIFGVESTSFSAFIAAAGVAIGVAWSGLLSNFAAGVFLILLRPFKVGDVISAAGVTGVVVDIGLFATTIDNGENSRVFVGNNKLFSDNILNYTINPYRIASYKIQVDHSVDPLEAIERFCRVLATVPGVEPTPAPSGEILEFNTLGTLIVVRAATHQSAYANIVAAGNKAIYLASQEARYPKVQATSVLVSRNS